MNRDLLLETEKLARSWAQHEAAWLRDYLVAGVEDPRLNLQSILSRHFLIHALAQERFGLLMQHEYRFAAALDWLLCVARLGGDAEGRSATLHALRRRSDNAEGLEIPQFVSQTFADLPAEASGCTVPNYLETFLANEDSAEGQSQSVDEVLNTFSVTWNRVLGTHFPTTGPERVRLAAEAEEGMPAGSHERPPVLSLLEPACGSANDYRFLERFGIARLFEYTGFDLCEKNIENARTLYPGVRFDTGNVFEIPASPETFDLCIIHDLLEHLSPAGLEQAIREVCRVTRRAICIGFFQMDEIPEHLVRPAEDYHWNLLSLPRMRDLFASQGFTAQAVHIGTFLLRQTGCPKTHNPNAYTLFLQRATGGHN